MFTYEITDDPTLAKIFYNGKVVDIVGPWDTRESALVWAESYVNMRNAGLE